MDCLPLRLDAVRWHDHKGLGCRGGAWRTNCHARFCPDWQSPRQAAPIRRYPLTLRPAALTAWRKRANPAAMDYIVLVLAGVVMGLIAAVPVGPVNLICIRRSFAFGPLNGFMSGLGAALGDGIFAAIMGFG